MRALFPLILSGCLTAEAGSFYPSATGGGGGGGGSSVTQAAYASCGTGSAAGDLCVTTDGPLWRVWDGSAWDDYYASLGPVTPPVCADMTWLNQSTSSCASRGGVLELAAPAIGSDSLGGLYETVPGATWTATICYQIDQTFIGFGTEYGIVVRDAAGGDLLTLGNVNGDSVRTVIWASPTAPGAVVLLRAAKPASIGAAGDVLCQRASSDGTDITWAMGPHPDSLVTLGTSTIATSLGADDEVGFGVNRNGTYSHIMRVVHWSVE